VCPNYFTESDNGLEKTWPDLPLNEAVWCNPSYKKVIPEWVHKAWTLRETTNTVLLFPCNKLDQPFFHNMVIPFARIEVVEGRIGFLIDGKVPRNYDKKKKKWIPVGNSQGSVLVYFGPKFKPGIGSFKQKKEIK